jgi:hypothetical protein
MIGCVVATVLAWVAIYAIALYTILLSGAPMLAASSVDPFSIICQSEGAPPIARA